MQDTIEKALINRLKKGDGEALEEMYDLYAPVLLSMSMRYMSCREDAEDVVHDSFIKILKGIKKFKPQFEGAFEAWIKRITVNTSINFLRKKAKMTGINGQFHDVDTIPDPSTQDIDLPEKMEPETAIKLIRELPAGYRTVLNLYVFERFSHKEIAEELDISVNTSKSQLSKARALLRKKVIKMNKLQQKVER